MHLRDREKILLSRPEQTLPVRIRIAILRWLVQEIYPLTQLGVVLDKKDLKRAHAAHSTIQANASEAKRQLAMRQGLA